MLPCSLQVSQLAAAQAEVVSEVGAIDALITSVCTASSHTPSSQHLPEEPGASAHVFLAAAGPLEEECARLAAKVRYNILYSRNWCRSDGHTASGRLYLPNSSQVIVRAWMYQVTCHPG
jgi:hypothetical protein